MQSKPLNKGFSFGVAYFRHTVGIMPRLFVYCSLCHNIDEVIEMAQKFDPETNSWFFYGKIKDALGIQRQYKKRGFPTKKAAKKAEIEFRENAIAPPAKITMFALEEEFIAWMKRQITESSINSYHYLFDRINARFGDIPPTAITSQLLQLYIDELDEKYSKKYVQRIYYALKKLFDYAVDRDYLQVNPIVKVKPNARKNELHKEMSFWEPEEFDRFIQVVDHKMYRIMFSILYYMGIRKGELLALRPSDVNLEQRTIDIKRSYYSRIRKITMPKTKNSIRTITMPDKLCMMMAEWMGQLKASPRWSKDCFLFGITEPVSAETLRRYFKEYIALAGVKEIRIHDLRHSHASYLINNMTDDYTVYDIAKRLGDRVDTVLSTYAHWFKAADRRLVDSMNRNMDNKQSAASGAVSSSYGELRELKELLDIGIITTEEFSMKKKQILGL